jgi:hypothetical protein
MAIKQYGGVFGRNPTFNNIDVEGTSTLKDVVVSDGIYLGGTGSANKLDDYEFGSFTPSIQGNVTPGAGTYTIQSGRFQKIGERVFVTMHIDWSAHTGAGSGIRIGGLPFTSAGTAYGSILTGVLNNVALTAGSTFVMASVRTSSNQADAFQQGSGGAAIGLIPFDSAGSAYLVGSYTV